MTLAPPSLMNPFVEVADMMEELRLFWLMDWPPMFSYRLTSAVFWDCRRVLFTDFTFELYLFC